MKKFWQEQKLLILGSVATVAGLAVWLVTGYSDIVSFMAIVVAWVLIHRERKSRREDDSNQFSMLTARLVDRNPIPEDEREYAFTPAKHWALSQDSYEHECRRVAERLAHLQLQMLFIETGEELGFCAYRPYHATAVMDHLLQPRTRESLKEEFRTLQGYFYNSLLPLADGEWFRTYRYWQLWLPTDHPIRAEKIRKLKEESVMEIAFKPEGGVR